MTAELTNIGDSCAETTIEHRLQRLMDAKTKPVGSLGRLEALAVQLGRIQQSLVPEVGRPCILICAGDHGAARSGLSAYPPDVTWQMVENFIAGGAAINVLARQAGIDLLIADAGVDHEFGPRAGLIDAKVARGTADFLRGPAMSMDQCATAIKRGSDIVDGLATQGRRVMGFGDMGIANTSSASLITHMLTGLPLSAVVGRGTGLDDVGLEHKRGRLAAAVAAWTEPSCDPLAVLARFGGFEIAMLVGAMQAAARHRMVLLIDGFIVTAALMVAEASTPGVRPYCVFAHKSDEAGHAAQLAYLKAEPLLDLGLRLGEGTGAALAVPLLRCACALLTEMASFESAGVSTARVS